MFVAVVNKKCGTTKFGSFALYNSENLSKVDEHTMIFLKIKFS